MRWRSIFPDSGRVALLALALVTASTAADPPLMPVHGREVEEATSALIQLAAGDAGRLTALPIATFTAMPAVADPSTPGLYRRWTMVLPAAIARLGPVERQRVAAALDLAYLGALPTPADGASAARIASDFLPGPRALAAVAAAADAAFDHGRFREFIACARLIGTAGERLRHAPERIDAAMRLDGRGAEVDAGLSLSAPGIPQPAVAVTSSNPGGQGVDWRMPPGWLVACDPWDRPLWQYRVGVQADIVVGAGAAVVRDDDGLRAIDEQGRVTPLVAPAGVSMRRVAGGAAWFVIGSDGWRLDLADGSTRRIALGLIPLGAPVVRGPAALWLGRDELLLSDGDQVVARLRHGLGAGSGWRLGEDRTAPLVIAPDGRAWRIPTLADQLATADAQERARLLLLASRPREAIAALAGDTSPEGRSLALRAHIASSATDGGTLDQFADEASLPTPQDRAILHLARLSGDGDPHPLSTWLVGSRGGGPGPSSIASAAREALERLADLHGDVLLTDDRHVLAWDPATWPHAVTGRGWQRALDRSGAPPPWSRIDLSFPVERASRAHPGDDDRAERRTDGTHRYRGAAYRLSRDADDLAVTCADADGRLLWRRRWPARSRLSAPSQGLDLNGGQVHVAEGDARLTVLDADAGVRRGVFATTGGDLIPSQSALLDDGRLAVLSPLGVRRRLTLHAVDGGETAIDLPAPATWMAPFAGAVLVALSDGRALRYPGAIAVDLPGDVVRGPAPLAIGAGLVSGDRLHPWRVR